MKRYLLFGGEGYSSNGGALDFESAHEDKNRAIRAGRQFLKGADMKWAHVFDLGGEKLVWHSNSDKERG